MRKIFKCKIYSLLGVLAVGVMAIVASAPTAAAPPKGAPAALKIAFVDFFSGGAAVFGISGKGTTEWLVSEWNKKGGIKGVPIDPPGALRDRPGDVVLGHIGLLGLVDDETQARVGI